jgi:hypothetical protein
VIDSETLSDVLEGLHLDTEFLTHCSERSQTAECVENHFGRDVAGIKWFFNILREISAMIQITTLCDGRRYKADVEEKDNDDGKKVLSGRFTDKVPPRAGQSFAIDAASRGPKGAHHVAGIIKLAEDGTFVGDGVHIFTAEEFARPA